jgi:hypothetical protein
MKKLLINFLLPLLAIFTGFGIGLAYSWAISPVEYVDASPALLRDDFKDQYRIVIAASYASSHDLARARARLELLSDTDPVGELSAQAQRTVGSSESAENVQLLAQLATDLQKGVVGVPVTSTPFPTATADESETTPIIATPSTKSAATQTPTLELIGTTSTPTTETIPTPFAILAFTLTPRPTITPIPDTGTPFILVGQDTVCDPAIEPGLLQFTLIDSRRRQIAGIEIIVSSIEGEDRLFTGFKPEVGNGYADFVMRENISYSVRVVEGGAFINNISAPICTDPNGKTYLGGLSLGFQQP